MARRLSLVIGILCFGLIGSAQQPDPSFATLSNLVVVPTLVLDKRGELLRGLTIDDFEVLEDGKPMPIEAFVAPGDGNAPVEGRMVVLVLDNLVSPPELAPQVRRIATSFVKRMSAADTISVITVSGGRSVTSDRQAELKAAIDRFRPFVGETIRTPGELAASGLEAIIKLSDQLGKVPHRRKVMVFIGAASVFSPQEPSAFEDRGPSLSERWFHAIRVTARENVSVYAVDPVGFTGRRDDYSESFAIETGGQSFSNASNFDAAVGAIWREAGSYYLLGYPAPINDHRLHKIEVRVRKPGVRVRSRKGRG